MKINPDRIRRLVDAVKVLNDMPFSVYVNTISGPSVQLFDETDFDDTFPDYEVIDSGDLTFHSAERDGITFECIVRMEGYDD